MDECDVESREIISGTFANLTFSVSSMAGEMRNEESTTTNSSLLNSSQITWTHTMYLFCPKKKARVISLWANIVPIFD